MSRYGKSAAQSLLHPGNGAQNTVIQFPQNRIIRQPPPKAFADPGITIRANEDKVLDKLGMSGAECCYILPPGVSQVSLELSDAEMLSDAQQAQRVRALIRKIILSEADCVSELVESDEDGEEMIVDISEDIHWIVPGKLLHFYRKSPRDVGMLSIEIKSN